jgi:hypothetical protein
LSRLTTSFVLGYHGCDHAVAHDAVIKGVEILQSDKDYDWLGPGAYFWESDPTRAMEWAVWKQKRGEYQHPAVVGAVIDLGHCLDLVSREGVKEFQKAYDSFRKIRTDSHLTIPENRNPKGMENEDRLLRFLDCAVFRHLHQIVERKGLEPYDSVRGMFVEGGRAFPTSGIYTRSHVQIAVRNPACIKGIFYPRGLT